MSLVRIVFPLALLGACGAQIADGAASSGAIGSGDDDGGPVVDAPGGGSGSSAPDAPPMATACNQRTLYLNFEGQALQRALVSDATKNQASWMQSDTATAPKFLQGNATRATTIKTIVDGVRAQLSTFPVTVVTDRPASGDYVMIVLGGQRRDVSSAYGAAVNTLDCGDLVKDDLAWISDGALPEQHVINLVLGATGFGLGLTGTSDPADCMCGWANDCQSNDGVACKLGSPIARDPDATQKCSAAGATQDEKLAVHDAFCGK
ncbi:MAG TPA: hypothetical protein VGC42_16485 [Kofleriaceae bacterium]